MSIKFQSQSLRNWSRTKNRDAAQPFISSAALEPEKHAASNSDESAPENQSEEAEQPGGRMLSRKVCHDGQCGDQTCGCQQQTRDCCSQPPTAAEAVKLQPLGKQRPEQERGDKICDELWRRPSREILWPQNVAERFRCDKSDRGPSQVGGENLIVKRPLFHWMALLKQGWTGSSDCHLGNALRCARAVN